MTQIIKRCNDEEAFYLHNGNRIHSVEELASAISSMDSQTFSYHQQREDFERWLSDVMNESHLASLISGKEQLVVESLLNKHLAKERVVRTPIIKKSKEKTKRRISHTSTFSDSIKDLRAGMWDFLLGLVIGIVGGILLITFL